MWTTLNCRRLAAAFLQQEKSYCVNQSIFQLWSKPQLLHEYRRGPTHQSQKVYLTSKPNHSVDSTCDTAEEIIPDVKHDKHIKTVTMFHKRSKHLTNINLDPKDTRVSIFFSKSKDLVTMTMKDSVRHQLREDNFLRKRGEVEEITLSSVEDLQWKTTGLGESKLIDIYLKLAKIRLTGMVVLTAMAGYAMAPGAFDPIVFSMCSIGTGLTSAAANTINQYLEIPYDSQMNRTKNRPLVRRQITTLHAVMFANIMGFTGCLVLALGANPLTAGLGFFNLVLYTLVYTPLKRLSISNTWIGSLVGAIPPMMGWAAATGSLDAGGWLLGAVLFAWQFPHFNALSWNLRPDYSRAGYRMMSVIDPALCKRVALRYCVGMTGLCSLAPVIDLTTWMFAVDSLPVNLYLVYLGWRFYRDGDSKSSRKLFRFSLVHIPLIMILMLISKKQYGTPKDDKLPQESSVEKLQNKISRFISKYKT